MKPEELKNAVLALQELGLSYQEALDTMSRSFNDLGSTKRLWKTGDKSRLTKLGLALITFPEPTPISETLGVFVLSLGLIQKKMNQSTLHIDDVYSSFQEVIRGLHVGNKEVIK